MYKYVHFIKFVSDSLLALFSVIFHYLELERAEEQSYFLFVQFVKDCEGKSNYLIQ